MEQTEPPKRNKSFAQLMMEEVQKEVDAEILREIFTESQVQAIVNSYGNDTLILYHPDGYEFIANLNQEGVTVGKKFLPMPESAFDDCDSLRHLSEWKYQIKKKGRHCDCDCDFCTHDFILRLQDSNGTTWEAIYSVSNGAGVLGFGETLEFTKLTEKV